MVSNVTIRIELGESCMRKMIIHSLIFLFFLTGCSHTPNSAPQQIGDSSINNHHVEITNSSDSEQAQRIVDWEHIVIEQANGKSGMLYLGMTLNDIYALDLYNSDYQITEIIEAEEGVTVIWTPTLCLVFDSEGILYRITVNGELAAPVGLKNGDSIDLLDNLLGKSDTTYDTGSSTVEEYNLGDFYFYADISEGKVSIWGISIFKYDYDVPQETKIIEPDSQIEIQPESILTDIEALELIESKLDQEQLRISYLGLDGTDDNGNYIIRQASSATTEVMEWYHVNPITQKITCEILVYNCFQDEPEINTEPLNLQQLDAIEIAKQYALNNYSQEIGYVDGITYVTYSHLTEEGNVVIWIYNPGLGMPDSVDFLTIDVKIRQVVHSQRTFTNKGNNQIQEQILKKLNENLAYEINLSTNDQDKGLIEFDFDQDGQMDILKYSTIYGKRSEYGIFGEKMIITLNGYTIVPETYDTIYDDYGGLGIVTFGVVDIDKSDQYIEFFLRDGYLRGGFARIYRLTSNGIEELVSLFGGIEAVSGTGHIYYWGGNLFETDRDGVFSPDTVLSYFDIYEDDFVETDQIVGKTITAIEEFIVYKSLDDVFDGQPVSQEDKIEQSKGKIVKIVKEGEKFEVISIENGTKIKTTDGKTGWIGGFHMVWD
jgi:hypothetical protein